jgi:hypothetical protein
MDGAYTKDGKHIRVCHACFDVCVLLQNQKNFARLHKKADAPINVDW